MVRFWKEALVVTRANKPQLIVEHVIDSPEIVLPLPLNDPEKNVVPLISGVNEPEHVMLSVSM